MVQKFILGLFIFVLSTTAAIAQAGGKVAGKVTFQGEVALRHTLVKIARLKISTVTDENGRYEISNVPNGIYTVLFHLEGFAELAKVVEIRNGEAVNLNARLQISSIKGEVTITSEASEQSVFDSFQAVNSVNSTRLIEKASVGIGATLENEAGVARRGFGVGSSRPVIRGFDNDRVLVTKDGIRTGSLGSQSGDHGETIDVLSAERVEIVKGPTTLLYGSNAMGGVVNAVTDDSSTWQKGIRGSFTTLGNTNNKQGVAAGGISYGHNNWDLRANGSFQREGDYNTPLGRIPNSSTRAGSGDLRAAYFSDKFFVKGNFSIDRRRFGIPYVSLFEEGEVPVLNGHEPPETPDEAIDINAKNELYSFRAGFRNVHSFIERGEVALIYTRYQQQELETADRIETLSTTFRNNTFSYRAVLDQKPYQRLTGRFGAEGFNRDYSVVGEEVLIEGAKVKQNSFSAFTLQTLAFKRIAFQIGGRVENNRFDPLSTELENRSVTGFSGGLSAKIDLWKGGNFILNYTNAFRSPSLDELYNHGPHTGTVSFEVGDSSLKGERTNGMDISLRQLSDRIRFEANFYYYMIKNFVYLSPVADGKGGFEIEDNLYVREYLQSDARYAGAEANLNLKLNNYVALFFGGDLTRAKLTKIDENAWRIPPAKGKIGLDFDHKNLNVRPEFDFVYKQDRVFLLETPTAGYGLFNLSASYTIAKEHYAQIFGFSSFNMADKLYRNHLSYIKDLAPEIGRGFRFSYALRFF